MQKSFKDKILETTYLACYVLYFVFSLMFFSPVGEHLSKYIGQGDGLKITNYCAMAVLFVIYIFKPHNDKKRLIGELLIVFIFAMASFSNQRVSSIFYLSQWTMYITIGFFIACSSVTDFKRIAIACLATSVAMFCLLNLSYLTGYVEEGYATRFYDWSTGFFIPGHYMGYYYFTHPSYYSACAWMIYMYLRGKKQIGWIELFAEFGVLYLLYRHTTCRLGFVCVCVTFALYIVVVKLNLIRLEWKFTRIAAAAGFPLAAIFTLLCGYFYSPENPILSKINKMISGRFALTKLAFERYNINLFGRPITYFDDGTYFYLDSAYTHALWGCGLIFFILVIAMFSYMAYYSCKTNNKPLFVWLATLAIFGIVGDVWVGITYTPLLLGFFQMFKERKSIAYSGENSAAQSPDINTAD